MTIYEAICYLEDHALEMKCARSILIEASKNFEHIIKPNSVEERLFILKAPHILNLLHVLETLMYKEDMISECIDAMEKLMKLEASENKDGGNEK